MHLPKEAKGLSKGFKQNQDSKPTPLELRSAFLTIAKTCGVPIDVTNEEMKELSRLHNLEVPVKNPLGMSAWGTTPCDICKASWNHYGIQAHFPHLAEAVANQANPP